MRPQFVLPETVARADGMGAEVVIENRVVRLMLGITRMAAEESLDVSVWGSPDKEQWRLLVAFPQKFHCGNYSIVMDLTRHADVRYLRAQWKVGRWHRDERAPLSEFYLLAGELSKVAADAVG
jgi:hypothetical protein